MKGSTIIYAPSTFEERGTAVAFTTPLLSQTRVRMDDRRRLEVLIPSFSEGKGIYVVPWKAVPDMVSMTVHDRFLHEQIVRSGGCSPQDIRKATLRAARSGLAGPDAVQAARAALAMDEEHRTLTNFLLMVEVLRTAGMTPRELLRTDLDSREGSALARSFMTKAAAALRLEPAELFARVSEMADAMSPVGLIQAPEPGRLRRRMRMVAEFRDSIAEWSRESLTDAAPVAAFCADVATHTLEIGERVLADFDRRAGAIGAAIRDWDAQVDTVHGLAARLAWLVDGWDYIVRAWDQARSRDQHEQSMEVAEIFRILPLVPRCESDHDHAAAAGDVLVRHRRSVRAYEDWRTGVLDVELVRRIERIKARAA
ncbi:hypothetical protein [Azospirillum halopraeferens]|uniref:hypothetical protein n=1 Tax=Azospirillum halopraeferens TaxID=34010 RepID=UPI0003F6875A|nr:hypothetical protein [Azospirillum halopraeferens]